MTDINQISHNSLVSDIAVNGSLRPSVQQEGDNAMEVVPRDGLNNNGKGAQSIEWTVKRC